MANVVIIERTHIMSKDSPHGKLEESFYINGELYRMTAKYRPAIINGEITPSNLFEMKLEKI